MRVSIISRRGNLTFEIALRFLAMTFFQPGLNLFPGLLSKHETTQIMSGKSLANLCCAFFVFFIACQDRQELESDPNFTGDGSVIAREFGDNIDLNDLYNYANQEIPSYIQEDNTSGNPITNQGATLGRVLFYDKNLSSDNSISCSSCHKQQFAFGDDADVSQGVNGTTGRHSMRLVNARFSQEDNFFWDERARSLEEQTTQPIRDHAEMGFSGQNGDPDFNDLINKLEQIDYYQELFEFVYGDDEITEEKMQYALAQFIRSIQSFDSKYDEGLAQARDEDDDFSNFTASENRGKQLFMSPPGGGRGMRMDDGAGCDGCHRAPEFSIDDDSRNNGVVTRIGGGYDYDVTRSPTLRDMVGPAGQLNGNLMHSAEFSSLEEVVRHYNAIPMVVQGLDNRLERGNQPQRLGLSNQDIADIVAFLETLSGTDVYTDERWSDPFVQ